MNSALLLENYARIADAPDAIARLRRFVLDLAVRGKLVEQDAEAEAATSSLKTANVKDFVEHPKLVGWAEAKIGQLLQFQYGKGLHANERQESGAVPVFGSNGIVAYTHTALTDKPSIIVGRKGSAGALNLCSGPSWTTDVAYFVEAPTYFSLRYLLLSLSALGLDQLGKGVKPGLSRSDAYALALGVPPLAEQHRIVGKVDELMALCDQLEAARESRETERDMLTAASFARLNAPDHKTFAADARFALANLAPLTTRADQIKHLRQTILNLAVCGKLARQDAADEVSDLPPLREFAAASGWNVEVFEQFSSTIKLPNGWKIAPLAQISANIVDCPHTTPKWKEEGELCIRTSQLRPGALDLAASRFVSSEEYLKRVERLEPAEGDILYSREGGILGIACRVPPKTRLCLGQRLMLIRAGGVTRPDFLEIVLNSPFITDIARIYTTGGAAPRVNMSTVRAYPIPVPPIAEQQRIVAKVNELMARCDQLEDSLTDEEQTRSHLLESVLQNALEPA